MPGRSLSALKKFIFFFFLWFFGVGAGVNLGGCQAEGVRRGGVELSGVEWS